MQTKNELINELSELNEELENYFSNTIIPQLFIDANLVLRKFTPPAMKQFNLKYEFIGRNIGEVQENFRFPTFIDNIKMVIDTGTILEKEIQTTDMHWYQMNILPYLVRKENKTNGVIITFVDITPRIRDLKEQEKLITEHELLLDTIAHDIKNPLLALGLTIQMLKKLPEKKIERFPVLLENVERSLFQMKKVIGDLVDSRWQEQRYQAENELLDLQNIIEDVRLTLAPQIAEAKASIIVKNLETSQIKFVRRKLRSVIYNLLNNAIKYAHPDRSPNILISSYQEDCYMVISFADNGMGISQENQGSIFEKFERVEGIKEGSGVGLYLVNTIVTAAGGKIIIESKEGKGSVFKVFLKADN
ncbi:ATP-binding protein [Pedobacter cryoconitis]|nr:ATP-binding protein [Pedobacter cryoconitis]